MKQNKTLIALTFTLLSSAALCSEGNTAEQTRQQECEEKLLIAQNERLILNISVKHDGFHVRVHQGWLNTPYTTKLGMARVIECAIAGPDMYLKKIIFRDELNNKAIAEYTYPTITVY